MRITGTQIDNLSLLLKGYTLRLDLDCNEIIFSTRYEPEVETSDEIMNKINDIIQEHKFKIFDEIYETYGEDFNKIEMYFARVDGNHNTFDVYWKLKSL